MSHSPTITNALVMPGVSPANIHWSLLVGLILDDRQIAWGECAFVSADSEHETNPNGALRILQEIIISALMGQPLANVVDLMKQMDQMRHQATIVKPITVETPPKRRSRRELFTSLINPAEEIQEIVERPLPPQLRNGVSQALISAVAMTQGIPIVEAVAQLYGLEPARTPLPLHLVFDDLPNPTDPALAWITAASYGLIVNDDEPLKELGSDGVRLQNRLRQLKNRAARYITNAATSHPETGFLFDLKGGYGRLYDQKSGPILGALNGLEQVAKPYILRLVDPIIMEDRASQIERMKELKEFLRFRKMGGRLLGRAWLETAEDIHAFADADCCDGVILDMSQLGTLNRAVELAQAAHKRGLAVVLGSVKGDAAVHTALALKPSLLAVRVGEVSAVVNEMNRTLAWQVYKNPMH